MTVDSLGTTATLAANSFRGPTNGMNSIVVRLTTIAVLVMHGFVQDSLSDDGAGASSSLTSRTVSASPIGISTALSSHPEPTVEGLNSSSEELRRPAGRRTSVSLKSGWSTRANSDRSPLGPRATSDSNKNQHVRVHRLDEIPHVSGKRFNPLRETVAMVSSSPTKLSRHNSSLERQNVNWWKPYASKQMFRPISKRISLEDELPRTDKRVSNHDVATAYWELYLARCALLICRKGYNRSLKAVGNKTSQAIETRLAEWKAQLSKARDQVSKAQDRYRRAAGGEAEFPEVELITSTTPAATIPTTPMSELLVVELSAGERTKRVLIDASSELLALGNSPEETKQLLTVLMRSLSRSVMKPNEHASTRPVFKQYEVSESTSTILLTTYDRMGRQLRAIAESSKNLSMYRCRTAETANELEAATTSIRITEASLSHPKCDDRRILDLLDAYRDISQIEMEHASAQANLELANRRLREVIGSAPDSQDSSRLTPTIVRNRTKKVAR